MVNIEQLKKLRESTGISLAECKKALEESNGDIEKAKKILREKGKETIKDRGDRGSLQGAVIDYIHPGGRIGVLLELRCETDFVAKSNDFKELGHEICLQIAASRPKFVKAEDIPEEVLEEEKKIYLKQFEGSNKPENVIEQIIKGKIDKFKEEICLLSQPWVKDNSKTVNDLILDYVAKIGENIKIEKFARFEI